MKVTSQSDVNPRCEQEEYIEHSVQHGVTRHSRHSYLIPFEYAIHELQVPGLLALLVFITIATIVLAQVFRAQEVKLPSFFSEIGALIVGFYFVTRTQRHPSHDQDS